MLIVQRSSSYRHIIHACPLLSSSQHAWLCTGVACQIHVIQCQALWFMVSKFIVICILYVSVFIKATWLAYLVFFGLYTRCKTRVLNSPCLTKVQRQGEDMGPGSHNLRKDGGTQQYTSPLTILFKPSGGNLQLQALHKKSVYTQSKYRYSYTDRHT